MLHSSNVAPTKTEPIKINVVRFPPELRNLYRQRSRRQAKALGLTRAQWQRIRHSFPTTLAGDMLIVLAPHQFAPGA